MPKIAEGDANKVWIVPSEIGKALEGLGLDDEQPAGHPRQGRRPAHAGGHGAAPSADVPARRTTLQPRRTTRSQAAIAAAEDVQRPPVATDRRADAPSRTSAGRR